MKMINRMVLGGVICVLLCLNASALMIGDPIEITPDSLSLLWTGGEMGVSQIQEAVEANLLAAGFGCAIEEVYKQDEGGPETGTYAASYTTEFLYTSDDPEDDPEEATIAWVSGTPYVNPLCSFLLVKDGNHNPAWYFFDLAAAGWDGRQTLELSGFWPGSGAISHVGIYNAPTSVPDGGLTIALLGLSLCALGVMGRKVR